MVSDKKYNKSEEDNCSSNKIASNGIQLEKINKLIQKRREKIDLQDIVQIIIGSFAAAIVFAPTNELISLSQNLPDYKLVIIFIFSLVFIILLAYGFGGRNLHLNDIQTIAKIIPVRLVLIFLISTIACLIALWIYDIVTVETPLIIVMKRIVVLLLPATWGGALIDLLHSKNR